MMGIKLSRDLMRYRWKELQHEPWVEFIDEIGVSLTKDRSKLEKYNLPRYRISFMRVPEGRKRSVIVWVEFNDDGTYDKTTSSGRTVKKRELKQWESECLSWLHSHGHITGYSDRAECV